MSQDEGDNDKTESLPARRRSDVVTLHKTILGTVIKLFIASLLVGLVMHWFDITPRSIIANFGSTVERAAGAVVTFISWAVDYVVVGAVIVVPIWAVWFLIEWAKRRRGE